MGGRRHTQVGDEVLLLRFVAFPWPNGPCRNRFQSSAAARRERPGNETVLIPTVRTGIADRGRPHPVPAEDCPVSSEDRGGSVSQLPYKSLRTQGYLPGDLPCRGRCEAGAAEQMVT